MRHHSLHSQKCVWLFCSYSFSRKLTSLLLVAALSFASLPAAGVALPGRRSVVLVRDTALLRALMLQSGGTAVTPILECVVRRHGNYTAARFGYNNDNLSSVTIPIGSRNAFSPAPADRSQTTTFLSGRQYSVFDVAFDGTPVSWLLPWGWARLTPGPAPS